MVTRTGGRFPAPNSSTIAGGTSIPVAVLPPSRIVARHLMML